MGSSSKEGHLDRRGLSAAARRRRRRSKRSRLKQGCWARAAERGGAVLLVLTAPPGQRRAAAPRCCCSLPAPCRPPRPPPQRRQARRRPANRGEDNTAQHSTHDAMLPQATRTAAAPWRRRSRSQLDAAPAAVDAAAGSFLAWPPFPRRTHLVDISRGGAVRLKQLLQRRVAAPQRLVHRRVLHPGAGRGRVMWRV